MTERTSIIESAGTAPEPFDWGSFAEGSTEEPGGTEESGVRLRLRSGTLVLYGGIGRVRVPDLPRAVTSIRAAGLDVLTTAGTSLHSLFDIPDKLTLEATSLAETEGQLAAFYAQGTDWRTRGLDTGERGLAQPADTDAPAPSESLVPESGEIPELILWAGRNSLLAYREQLAERLETLVGQREEEIANGLEPASVESLRQLLRFLIRGRHLRRPGVVITPRGNFRARWRESRTQFFAAELFPNGRAKWVLFCPDSCDSGQTARTSGIQSADSLLRSAEDLGAFEWMSLS